MLKDIFKIKTYLKLNFVLFLTLSLFAASAVEAKTTITINTIDSKYDLALKILKLALSKTIPDVEIVQKDKTMPEGDKWFSMVNSGKYDLLIMGMSPDAEKALDPVRVPIMRGLLGMRVSLIKAENKHMFKNVKNLDDLKKFSAGSGRYWGDTAILKAAKIPTITTLEYENLFSMLEGGRFDYYPRAIYEPWLELEAHKALNLTTDDYILLYYPMDLNFYVAKGNKKLNDKIYRGLEIALEDGSYNKLFFNHPQVKDSFRKAKIANRKVIKIPNPSMNKVRYGDKKFWLDMDSIGKEIQKWSNP